MKKMKLKIIWVLVWIFILWWTVFALNSVSTWYKVNKSWWKVNIDAHWDCREVRNNSSTNNYFIPTKSSTEWSNFKSHLPSWVSLPNECFIDARSNPSEANWWHIKSNSNHIQICVHWNCKDWYPSWDVDTKTSLTSSENPLWNFPVYRGTLTTASSYNNDTRKYYYIRY